MFFLSQVACSYLPTQEQTTLNLFALQHDRTQQYTVAATVWIDTEEVADDVINPAPQHVPGLQPYEPWLSCATA